MGKVPKYYVLIFHCRESMSKHHHKLKYVSQTYPNLLIFNFFLIIILSSLRIIYLLLSRNITTSHFQFFFLLLNTSERHREQTFIDSVSNTVTVNQRKILDVKTSSTSLTLPEHRVAFGFSYHNWMYPPKAQV